MTADHVLPQLHYAALGAVVNMPAHHLRKTLYRIVRNDDSWLCREGAVALTSFIIAHRDEDGAIPLAQHTGELAEFVEDASGDSRRALTVFNYRNEHRMQAEFVFQGDLLVIVSGIMPLSWFGVPNKVIPDVVSYVFQAHYNELRGAETNQAVPERCTFGFTPEEIASQWETFYGKAR